MMEGILLVIAIILLVRRPKLKRLTNADYPDVSPQKFAAWQKMQMRTIDLFGPGTLIIFLIRLGVFVLLRNPARSLILRISFGSMVLSMLILIIAAAYWRQTNRLREDAGIAWPKQFWIVERGIRAI